jgi:hypothetical protein
MSVIASRIVGFIMFGIGVCALSWEQGVHEAKHGRHTNPNIGWTDTYMNRLGSANAKRNMRRGYRYSKRK